MKFGTALVTGIDARARQQCLRVGCFSRILVGEVQSSSMDECQVVGHSAFGETRTA